MPFVDGVADLYRRRAERLLELDGWSDDQRAFLRKVETSDHRKPNHNMLAQLLKMERMAQTQRTPDPMP